METPHQFYSLQITQQQEKIKAFSKKLWASGLLRFVVFALTIFGVYTVFGNLKLVIGTTVIGVALFLFLVSRHSNLKYQKSLAQQLLELNKLEVAVSERKFHHLPNGAQFNDPSHEYSQDIDLFGTGSLFQYMNRTSLESGAKVLVHSLTANEIDHIPKKQEAVKELAGIPKWRQLFSASAALVKTQVSSDTVLSWLQETVPFTPKMTKVLCYGFSIVSVLLTAFYFLSLLPGELITIWFFIGLAISGLYVKRVTAVAIQTEKMQSTFDQFQKLLEQIEAQEFTSDLLSEKRALVKDETKSASAILRQFSRYLNALDQRNNLIIAVFANAFMLRDILQVHHIEQWIITHTETVAQWFDAIAFFDGYNSLGNYYFNHPAHCFPEITANKTTLSSNDAGHPLLSPTVSITNDISIDTEQFFIVTGANMAGKSTFLRTVALQIVMANAGLPVCATTTSYTPIKLITSMRTTDSLTDDESYFFSELKRLKFIVDTMKTERYFIILDEILKGTNSTDKAIGSRKFIEKLVASKSTGIIATHDLSLCEAANTLPEVVNYYFDAQIIDDELHFDYRFKEGICQNMNASFLLKKMQIVD